MERKKMKNDSLGDRMKRYEAVTQTILGPRSYTIVRIDGRSFSQYTKGLDRPFDDDFRHDMQQTAKALAEQVSGCVLSYTQSDEISLVLQDFTSNTTQAFFDGNVQKIVSITAGIATAEFNLLRMSKDIQRGRKGSLPIFDSRVFTVPNWIEAYNVILWRQQDSTRNALQMVAQSLYSHKELQGKKWSELHEMVFQKGINFNDYPAQCKRGTFIVKEQKQTTGTHGKTGEVISALRNEWVIVEETPLLTTEEGRDFFAAVVPNRDLMVKEVERTR